MTLRASSPIGLVLFVLAAVVMYGWLAHEPAIVGSGLGPQMVFNTALCFALSGLALAVESVLPASSAVRLRAVLGTMIALLSALVLAQYATGLDVGIDWPQLHRWLIDSSAAPGRMSEATSLAFLLAGVTFVLMGRVRGLWNGLAVQAMTGTVFLLGAIGVTGRMLRLELVYPNYLFGQMALATGGCFIALATALWLRWRRMDWYRTRNLVRREEERISLTGAAVLALVVCASVLAGFAVMSRQLEEVTRERLLEPLRARTDLFRINLDLRSTRAAMIGTRPSVIDQLAVLHRNSGERSARASLRTEAESLLPLGFSGVAFYGAAGELYGAAGSFVKRPQLALGLDLAGSSTLLWDAGFVLRTGRAVRRGDEPLGTVLAEQRLDALTRALQSADEFAESAEIVICGREAADLRCVRQRPAPPVFHIPYLRTLPIARALAAQTGVVVDHDYRGDYVIAAHGPIGGTGLGMVIKMDTAELYAPMRTLLQWVLGLIALSVAAGAWLLRLYITPLVRRLSVSEERLALALEGSRLALWDLDVRAGGVWLDERWREMTGGSPGPTATTLSELERLVHPEDLPAVQEHLREVLEGVATHYDIEHRVKRPSGEWLWIRSRGRVVQRDANGRPLRLAGTNSNIDRRKQAELELAHRAAHDALTGLPNRHLFRDRLERALARSERNRTLMAVMYLDIDKFKGVNDTFGHDTGDALIRAFAQRLVECIRSTDTAARLGGDEFAVILEALHDRDAARQIAAKIVAAMRREFELGARTLAVSTSVGMAFYLGEEDLDADAILKRADEALYQAKAAGRDTFRVSAEASP